MTYLQYLKNMPVDIRPYLKGETLPKSVSVSDTDRRNGSPKVGDMLARNPEDHNDRWLISEKYFKENYILKP